MTVAHMAVNCPFVSIDILGSGLIGDEKLKLKDPNGIFLTFTITVNTPYRIRLEGFNPYPQIGQFQLYYDNRLIFETILQCPAEQLSGIYSIDSNRQLMRDTYYFLLKKIPNPTIRTALIGE